MSIMEQLKADQLHLRKHVNDLVEIKFAINLLTTLLGEAAMIGKNKGNRETTDEEVLSVMKKFLKNINETLDVRPDTPGLDIEKQLLIDMIEQHGPKQLTEAELRNSISAIISIYELSSPKDMGKVMAALKGNHAGLYDGRMASIIAKEMLNDK